MHLVAVEWDVLDVLKNYFIFYLLPEKEKIYEKNDVRFLKTQTNFDFYTVNRLVECSYSKGNYIFILICKKNIIIIYGQNISH